MNPNDIQHSLMPLAGPLFEHKLEGPALRKLVLKNALLTILSLGFYRFWARADVRHFLWSHTTFMGEPLEYSGTGGQLFRSFLVVLFLFVLPLAGAVVYIRMTVSPFDPYLPFYYLALYAVVFFFVTIARYRARAYRLSHTRWRGIRAGQAGYSISYFLRVAFYGVLNVLSFGWYLPASSMRLTGYLTDNMRFGSEPFVLSPSTETLYRPFAFAWFRLVILIGMVVAAPMVLPIALADEQDKYHGFIYRSDVYSLYYKGGVTRNEAAAMDRYLIGLGFLEDEGRVVQLNKKGNTYQFRMVIQRGLEYDSAFLNGLQPILEEVSDLFGGARTEFHFCNENLESRRVVRLNQAEEYIDDGTEQPSGASSTSPRQATDLPDAEIWWLVILVVFVLLPLNFAWYKAALYSQIARCTGFGNLRFEFNGSGLGLFWLQFVNNIIMVLTLGLGVAITQRRKFSYVCRNLIVAGEFDAAEIHQNPDQAHRRGEGLADALDLGEV
jgi:uncharacterized membrane protein YjgN (DUF898 family)